MQEVIIQRVITVWARTKGVPIGAELRARLPMAYALPKGLLRSASPCFHHAVTRAESDDYRAAQSWQTCQKPCECLGIAPSVGLLALRGELKVMFMWNEQCGLPRREPFNLRIRSGQWVSVRYNGGFPSRDRVRYEERAVNVAFQVAPDPGLFLGIAPTEVVDRRVLLK